MSESHWLCFILIDEKSFYFDSFGNQPDKFLLKHSPKPIRYHTFKIHDKNSQLGGSYCLYFMYLIERMNFKNDALLKMYFDKVSLNE